MPWMGRAHKKKSIGFFVMGEDDTHASMHVRLVYML